MKKYTLYLDKTKIGSVVLADSEFLSAIGKIKYEQNIPDKVKELIMAYEESELLIKQGSDEESLKPVESVYTKYPELFEKGTWFVIDESNKKEGVLLKSLTENEVCIGAWFDDELEESY